MKVDKFIFPADFVVLDIKKDHDAPLILGRPFLATGRALIDVQSNELTLRVNGEKVNLSIYRPVKLHDEKATCHQIDSIRDHVVKTHMDFNLEAPLERCSTPLRVDGSKSTNEGTMHDLYTQRA